MNKNLRIAYNFHDPITTIDPANIQTLEQANLIENLYSRLIDYDENGEITCTLCTRFWIEKNILNFEIKTGIKTQSGYEIGVTDISNSFHRLFRLNTNTHGSLLHFINDQNDIYEENNILKIKLKKEHYSQFLLPLLTAMDFSIIPNISINKENKIFEYKNTSGAYFVFNENGNGDLTLKLNQSNNVTYSSKAFNTLTIIPTNAKDNVDAFLNDKVDIIDITCYPRTNIYEKLFNQNLVKFNFEKTIPINLFLLTISPKAHTAFNSEQIFYALKIVSHTFSNFKTYGYGLVNKTEFFSDFGNGHLSKEQIDIINRLRNANKVNFQKQIELGVMESSYLKVVDAFKDYKEIKIVSFKHDPAFLPINERPDIYIRTTDSSFNEDFSLISYNLSMEFLGKTANEGNEWMGQYLEIQNKEERIKKLQNLHFEILSKPYVYPIGTSPYWAISKPNLKLNFPKLFPGSHWWKIRQI